MNSPFVNYMLQPNQQDVNEYYFDASDLTPTTAAHAIFPADTLPSRPNPHPELAGRSPIPMPTLQKPAPQTRPTFTPFVSASQSPPELTLRAIILAGLFALPFAA